MPIVEIKDYGVEIEFPDSMAPEAIQAALRDRVMPELQRRHDRPALEAMSPFGRAQVLERARNGGAQTVPQAIQQIAGDYSGAAPSGTPSPPGTTSLPAGAAPLQIPAGMGTPERAGLVPRQDVSRGTLVSPPPAPPADAEDPTIMQRILGGLAPGMTAEDFADQATSGQAPMIAEGLRAGLGATPGVGMTAALSPDQRAAFIASGGNEMLLGLPKAILEAAYGEGAYPQPRDTAENIAAGGGALAGFIVGPAKVATLEGQLVKRLPGAGRVLERLAPKAGDKLAAAWAKVVAQQALHLGAAFRAAHLGDVLSQQTVQEAVQEAGSAQAHGMLTGGVFGAVGSALPSQSALQTLARVAIINASMDAITGGRPWDERDVAQKVFDYGVNTYFGWKGHPLPRTAAERPVAAVDGEKPAPPAELSVMPAPTAEAAPEIDLAEIFRRQKERRRREDPQFREQLRQIEEEDRRLEVQRQAEAQQRAERVAQEQRAALEAEAGKRHFSEVVPVRDLKAGDRVKTPNGDGQVVKVVEGGVRVATDTGEMVSMFRWQRVRRYGAEAAPAKPARAVKGKKVESQPDLSPKPVELGETPPPAVPVSSQAPARPQERPESPEQGKVPDQPAETPPGPAQAAPAASKPESYYRKRVRARIEALAPAELAEAATRKGMGGDIAREILAEREGGPTPTKAPPEKPMEAEVVPAQKPPTGEPISYDLIARTKTSREGTVVGTVGDFLQSESLRALYKDALDIPIMRLDRPVAGGRETPFPAGYEYRGGIGTAAGSLTIFVSGRYTGKDIRRTLFEEAAHAVRKKRGRPSTRVNPEDFDWDLYKNLPEEKSGKAMAEYAERLFAESQQLPEKPLEALPAEEAPPVQELPEIAAWEENGFIAASKGRPYEPPDMALRAIDTVTPESILLKREAYHRGWERGKEAGLGSGPPPPEIAAKPEAPAKEPWEMTREEWLTSEVPAQGLPEGYEIVRAVSNAADFRPSDPEFRSPEALKRGKDLGLTTGVKRGKLTALGREVLAEGQRIAEERRLAEGDAWDRHVSAVYDAIDAGKPVPPEVLKDYPDLAAKAAEAPAIDLEARRAARPTGSEGMIRVEPLRAQAPADPEGFAPEAKWGLDYWTEGLQNSLIRIDRIEKWGRSRGATAEPGKAAEAYIGRAGHRIDQAMDALEAILKPAFKEGFKPSELGRYMQALHVEERQRTMAERGYKGDEAAGMTVDEARQIIASMPPEIKKHAAKVREYIDETLDIMVEGQLIPADVAAEWRQRWPNYVPLLRDFGAGEAVSPGGGGRGFGASAGVKRAKGSKREALPILAQVATARARAIELAERGRVGREMLKLIEETGLEKHGWRVEDAEGFFVDKDGELVLRDALKDMKNKDNVIAVPVEGRTVKIVIPPYQKGLIRAMQGLGVERSLPVFSQINHFLRYMATTGNLEFLVTNFTRDLQEASIHLGERGAKMQGSVIKDVPAALRGVAEHLAGKDTEWARWREEMASEGGLTHWSRQSRDVNKMAAEIEKLAGRIEDAKTPEARAAAAIRTIGAGVEAMNAVVEGGVRLSAYVNLRKAGVAPREAALFAKNMTLNFDKKGRWGGLIGSGYLFFNVGVQGPVRMMQFAKKNPARFASMASALAVAGYLEAMHNHSVNRDEYEKRSPWERDNFWSFMFPGDKGAAAVLRVPYGYSTFKALGGMTYDLHAGLMQDREAAERMFSVLVDGFSPIQGRTLAEFITPSAGDPIVQLGQNKSWFGTPIRPEQPPYGAKKPDSQLYFKSARPYSVALAKKLNEATGGNEVLSGWVDISPETIDYLTDFIGGGAGKLAGRTTSTITSLVRGEAVDTNQVPFSRQFYRVSNKYAERSAVYHMLDESARRIYTDAEVEKFNLYLEASVEDGLLDKNAAKRIGSDFAKNQAKAIASKKGN